MVAAACSQEVPWIGLVHSCLQLGNGLSPCLPWMSVDVPRATDCYQDGYRLNVRLVKIMDALSLG
jgi:hypothetical protein